MFSTEIILLQQPAPPAPVTVQKVTEGGGAEIRTLPRQQPLLQFEFKQLLIVTGTIQEPIVIPKIVQKISLQIPITGRIAELRTLLVPVYGTIQRHLQARVRVTGEITENPADLERDIADLKFILDKKRRRREQ